MRVILEITDGPVKRRKLWLREHQSLSVGRTQKSDFVLGEDAMLSSVHFSLSCDATQCVLRDLQSTNGTFVNEQRITEAVLNSGDVVRAGGTRFLVTVDVSAGPLRSTTPAAESRSSNALLSTDATSAEEMETVRSDPPRPAIGGAAGTAADSTADARTTTRSTELLAQERRARPQPPAAQPATPIPPAASAKPPQHVATPPPPEAATNIPAWKVELYQRFVEEAGHLYLERHAWQADPTIDWPDVDLIETRLEAHMDGLMVGREEALRVCQQMLQEGAGGDPGMLHVITRLFLRQERRDLFDQLVEQLDEKAMPLLTSVADAVRDEYPTSWHAHLQKQLPQASPKLLHVVSKLVVMRGLDASTDMIRASTEMGEETLPEMLITLGRTRDYRAHQSLQSWLSSQAAPEIRRTSAIAMLCLGAPHVVGECLQRVKQDDWPLLPLGLGGGSKVLKELLARVEKRPHPDAFIALGLLGDVSAVNHLWAGLSDEATAPAAALALYLLTGAPLEATAEEEPQAAADESPEQIGTEDVTAPDADADDTAAEEQQSEPPAAIWASRASRSPAAWQHWWRANRQAFRPGRRYRLGQPYGPRLLVQQLAADHTPHHVRQLVFQELVIRYNVDAPFETGLSVADQRRALSELDDWVRSYGDRFDAGLWYFAGQRVD